MAINIPIITEFADQGLKTAQGAFDTFKGKVAEAEGGMGKFKAGANVALDAVKANAGLFLASAGAAIATFAYNAIKDFQDLALNVDEFRNITQLTLDQSSAWVSYTGDLGIEADAIIKIFGRLAKAATDEIPAFEELGVAVAFGPDGATDIEETFFRVNDAINRLDDPVAEAAYRADLFGKGWMSAAEIIELSSDDIKTALKGVKDFEVIDEDEIQKAKDLREAQDELGDAFARLSIKLGEKLIPVLEDAVELLIPMLEVLGKFGGTVDQGLAESMQKAQDMGKSLSDIARELGADSEQSLRYMAQLLGMSLDDLYKQLDRDLIPETYFLQQAWEEGTRAMIEAKDAAEDLGDELLTVDDALAELKGNVNDRREWNNLIGAIEDAKKAAIDAFFDATPRALRESQDELDDARLKVAEYVAELDTIDEDKKTEIIAALDQANLAEIEAIFEELSRNRTSIITVETRTVGGDPVAPGDTPSESRRPGTTRRPIGTPITSPARPLPSITIPALHPSLRSGVIVNVAGSVISENDLVETVRKGLVNSQRNGAGLVYSNR